MSLRLPSVLTFRVKTRLCRIWNSSAATFRIRSSFVHLRNALRGGPKPIRLLLVSDGGSPISEKHFAPIFRHAHLLRNQLGVVVQHCHIHSVLQTNPRKLSQFDIIGLMLSFRTPSKEVERLVKHFRTALVGTPTKLVYFDGDDDINIQWPTILSMVDLYVKNHVFADDQAYLASYIGKSNLTDYVARNYNVSFSNDIIPSSGALDPKYLSKIRLGWNLALGDSIVELLQRIKSVSLLERDIDISCRAGVPQNGWIDPLRSAAIGRVKAMSNRFRVIASRERVTIDKYYEEMLRSRICVSPFGYGEICWRDFEAIACGCLLVKPDMGHLRTLPNLYIPGGTYVSVRWDYSDLEEKCAPYLLNDLERRKIAKRARQLLIASLQADWFLDRFRELLACAGVRPQSVSTRSSDGA